MKSSAARRALVVGAIPLALAVACSNTSDQTATVATGSPTRSAAPQGNADREPGNSAAPQANPHPGTGQVDAQAGSTSGPEAHFPGSRPSSVQPGVASPAGDQDRSGTRPSTIQPGVTAPNLPKPQLESPSADYPIPANFRPIPNHEAAPALDFQTLHAPTVVTPVLPIAPPPRTLRIGEFSTPAPDQVPDDVLDTANGLAANTEAGLATGLNSIGVNPSRSDKIAAGTLGGAAIGAGLGAVGAGVPAAVIGGAIGAGVGAGIGALTGAAIGTAGVALAPWLAPIDVAGGAAGGALIGAGVGAAAGAAVTGIPAAVAGGAAGGIAGGAIGGFLGGAL
ncbi:hypothetical protein [Nocardia yunnanensis]|uniref:hypothetical protein n=1 Tax=Nocardia yunnanensis TaxID=2382165 RepID=UPI0013C4365F|nr:hypothetical protein [Nocardia yunnanensis]